jgi:GTP-binding protein HflX
VSDALFVTLDPLVRQVELPDRRRLLISDTVGFIDRLPHALVAAFRATLEEVADADLLLHVIDASSDEQERHAAAVRRVLVEVGAHEVPTVTVLNKCDRLAGAARERLRRLEPAGVQVSAVRGDGEDVLIDEMVRRLSLDTRRVHVELDGTSSDDRRRIRQLYRYGRVLRHESQDGRVEIEADVPRRMLDRLQLNHEVTGGSCARPAPGPGRH